MSAHARPTRRLRLLRCGLAVAGLTVPALVAANHAGAADDIVTADAGEGSPAFYRVEPGDGFYAIANELGVDIESLLGRNGLSIDFALEPGYVLLVPEEGYVPPTTLPPETTAPAETQPPATEPAATQPPEATQAAPPAPETTQPAAAPTAPAETPAPTPPPPTEPATTPAPPPPSGTGDCVVGGIGWINDARAGVGLPAIGQSDASTACNHSRSQAEAQSMFHGAGGCGWEIVGYSSGSWEDLPGAWLASPDHYAIVTSPEISSGAVAYVQNLSTGYWYGTGTFC